MHIGASPENQNSAMNMGESLSWNEHRSDPPGTLLDWWYRLAAPKEPDNSTPQDRERIRAGRLSSIILLIMLGFGLSQLPNALVSKNHAFLLTLLTAMAINVVAFTLNRRGKVMAVGIMMVTVVEVAFIIIELTSTNLTSGSLMIFYLMVVTELMAVSLLPPKSVFLVTLCNGIFTWAIISFFPRAASFTLPTPASYYNALVSPLVLQIIVATITYLWVQGARQAIARAEQVAQLERELAERDRAALEQKYQLEQGIQQILQTHVQAANGNFDARAPLAKENVLWQVASGLNHLLARLQRASQSENELQRTGAEVSKLVEAVRYAKARQRPVQSSKSGTILDPLAQELAKNYINQP